MGPVGRQGHLGHDAQVVRVKPMQVTAVDRMDRPVRVRQDCATPHMFAARQFGRCRNWLKCLGVDALHPTKRGRPAECRHRASDEPFAGVALDHHHIPSTIVDGGDRRGTGGSIKPSWRGLLSLVASTFNWPWGWPITGMGCLSVESVQSHTDDGRPWWLVGKYACRRDG